MLPSGRLGLLLLRLQSVGWPRKSCLVVYNGSGIVLSAKVLVLLPLKQL